MEKTMNGKLLFLAIASLLGILTSLFHFFLFLVLMICYLFILFKFKHFRIKDLLVLSITFIIFLFAGYGARTHHSSVIPQSTTSFYLEYIENAKIDGDLLQVTAVDKQWQERVLVRYKLPSKQEKDFLLNHSFYGVICKVTGELKNPALAKNPNSFDYRSYLEMKKIYWIVDITNNPLQQCVYQKSSILVLLKQLRYSGIHALQKLPPEIAALSAALIFGDRNLVDPQILSDYQSTGIVHLLAISGLHVSLLIGMVYYMGLRFGLTRQCMTNFLLILLPVYAVLTGMSPSVNRSVITIFLVLITSKWKGKRPLSPLDAISLAWVLYLLIDPFVIKDIGFQLSFSVSFAIIMSAPFLLKQYQNPLLSMFAISLISQLAAFPLLLYHYFEVPIISIAANLLYIPLYSFVFLPGLYLIYLFSFMCMPPSFLTVPLLAMITLSNKFISILAEIPFSKITLGRPNWWMVIIYIFLILAIFYTWESSFNPVNRKRLIWLVIVLISFQYSWNKINPYGTVTMIDVGQGDSFLIHLPFGKGNYLIDTGGVVPFQEEKWRERQKPYEVGRDTVVPYLKGQGITSIDKLILSHGDMDHIGGALSVINTLKVKQILIPSVVELSNAEKLIVSKAAAKGIPVIKVSERDLWVNGKSYFYILSPVKDFSGERNRGSIAIFANVGGISWFFGGDLDQEGEEEIIKKYPKLKVDVLKAGHHGSKTSSADAFITQLKPKVSLISVGEKNRFGHPHKEVLDKLKNTIIYRTDKQGAVTYQFFREKGTFSAYLP
jgi:competence protein ComEC